MLDPPWVSVRQLLLPAHCAACGAPAPPLARLPLCDRCGYALAQLIAAPYCPRCGRHAGSSAIAEGQCLFCRQYPIRHDATVRVGAYEEPLRSLILKCKHERQPELAPLLGRLLGERLAIAPWGDLVDVVVPVPLHWSRRIRRGFNQADLVAQALVRACGRPVQRRHLRRIRPTPHQRDLDAKLRPRNVRGAFAPGYGTGRLTGKSVLLVDDVMTSGTTVAECVRVLRSAGAKAVYVAVVATADYDEPGMW
jgi:ComF family protein